jgi:hypothetical protein
MSGSGSNRGLSPIGRQSPVDCAGPGQTRGNPIRNVIQRRQGGGDKNPRGPVGQSARGVSGKPGFGTHPPSRLRPAPDLPWWARAVGRAVRLVKAPIASVPGGARGIRTGEVPEWTRSTFIIRTGLLVVGGAGLAYRVSRRKRSSSSLGMRMWRSARDGRINPRRMRHRTLLSQTPNMRAVSCTL